MKHLEFEKLVKSFEGFDSPSEEREVSGHLRACTECAAMLAKLESFFRYVKADKNAKVSQAETARLLNIFRPKTEVSAARRDSKIKRLLASLIFDDWQTAVQERLAFSDSRHLLYRAGQFEIDLRLHFAGGGCQVSGQVFPDCISSAQASAEIFSAETSEKVFLNDCGEFVFPPVKEGIYNFRLDSGETAVEIENLSLVN
jgi:hypothetical protein